MEKTPDRDVTRRDFFRKAALGAVGAGALMAGSCQKPAPEGESTPVADAPPPVEPQPAQPVAPTPATSGGGKSKVVIARHSGVTANAEVLEAPLGQMIDRTVMELSGEDSADKAWRKYFSSDEVVGVKVNGLGGPSMATSVVLTKLCVERLQGIGIAADNIIIWDSNRGFLANCGLQVPSMWGARVMTMGEEWDNVVEQGSFRGPITAIVTRRVDGFLNLPIVKDHGISGITLAMKNHYGSHQNPSDHHSNRCDPYIADLNTIPAIRDKQRLIICDGTRGQAKGGPSFNPQYAWNPNLVMAAVDRVAHDTVGWQIIEAKRKEFGLGPIERDGGMPRQLISAAERGLGTNDLAQIDRVELNLA